MSVDPAPVAIFAYRRPDHLARTLEALRANPTASTTFLTVFCDGAKGTDDAADVESVRRLAVAAEGFASVRVVSRVGNVGLAANVISGVTQMLENHDRIVVLEDDMVVSVDFLKYMNEALEMYAEEPRVISVHGYVYPSGDRLPDYFFLRGADCWGWGTWRRGWALFEEDGQALLDALEGKGLTEDFDFGGAFGYTRMLRDQIAGRVDSWAVRWYASAFLAGRLTLYPGESLVENIGLDGSGTHSRDGRGLATEARRMKPMHPIPVEESPVVRLQIARALTRQRSSRWRWRLSRRPRG